MAKIKRRPKPRRKHRKANEQLLCIVAYATISVFVLIYIFGSPEQEGRNDSDGDVFTSTKESAIRLAGCRSSCDELVLSKVSASSPGPSTALATSAVDALFSIQDAHNESSTERRQTSEDGQRKQRIDSSARKHDFTRDDNSLLKPIQLPPLIETLIGTVDEQNVFMERYGRHHRRRRNNKKIIRKEGPKKAKGSATSSQRRRGDRSSSDQVQMAAAAAAAAVWSESARYWGRHRMRTLNEEWDAALRWIAGWGHQYEIGNGDSFQHAHRDPAERARNMQGQNGVSSYDRDGIMEDFTLLFDTCVDECLENYAGSVRDGQWGDSLTGDILGISRDIAAKFISSLWGKKETERIQTNTGIVLINVYRIIISSLFVYAARFLWRWWYCILLSSGYLGESPQWLLDETGTELESSGACNRHGQRRNLGESKKKGVSSKKVKRKRKSRNHVHNREVPKKGTEDNKAMSTSPFPRSKSDHKEDGGRRNDVPHVHASSTIDHKEYESAKEGDADGGETSSATTCTNASLCSSSQCSEPTIPDNIEDGEKENLHSRASTSESAQPFPSECINCIHPDRRMATDASDGVSSMASSFLTSSTPSPILAPTERHVPHPTEGSENTVPCGSSDIIWHPESTGQPDNIMNATNSLRKNRPFDHSNSDPVVPTDEQREEASRQLREFQRIQIQRIVQRKAALEASQQGNKPYAPPLQIPIQGANTSYSPAPLSVTMSPPRVCNSVIGPPPKATLSSNNASSEVALRPNELEANATGCLTGDELLLSNMLDEDDEAETLDVPLSPTIPPGFGGNTTTKPYALVSDRGATLTRDLSVQSPERSGTDISNSAWASLQTSPVGKRNETQEPPSLSLGNSRSSGTGIRGVVGSPIGSPVLSVAASTWSSHETGTW